MLSFAVGAALVSVLLAVSVFTISRGYLTDQRERSAQRIASGDADTIGRHLAAGMTPEAALTALDPPASARVLLYWDGEWVSNGDSAPADLPPDQVRTEVTAGSPGVAPMTIRDTPYLVVGIPLRGGGAFYEYAPVIELRSTIRTLGVVLAACAAAATVGAALLGAWASRRALRPLKPLASTAASIVEGNLESRLPQDGDADLEPIVTSFNTMVDSLRQRIAREQRFVGDVSHELRTPLTTLVTSVEVMTRHADELPERPRRALALVASELDHLRRMLDDLLDLARAEAGLHHDDFEPLSLTELVRHVLSSRGYPDELLTADTEGSFPAASSLWSARSATSSTTPTATRAGSPPSGSTPPGTRWSSRSTTTGRASPRRTASGSSSGLPPGARAGAPPRAPASGSPWWPRPCTPTAARSPAAPEPRAEPGSPSSYRSVQAQRQRRTSRGEQENRKTTQDPGDRHHGLSCPPRPRQENPQTGDGRQEAEPRPRAGEREPHQRQQHDHRACHRVTDRGGDSAWYRDQRSRDQPEPEQECERAGRGGGGGTGAAVGHLSVSRRWSTTLSPATRAPARTVVPVAWKESTPKP